MQLWKCNVSIGGNGSHCIHWNEWMSINGIRIEWKELQKIGELLIRISSEEWNRTRSRFEWWGGHTVAHNQMTESNVFCVVYGNYCNLRTELDYNPNIHTTKNGQCLSNVSEWFISVKGLLVFAFSLRTVSLMFAYEWINWALIVCVCGVLKCFGPTALARLDHAHRSYANGSIRASYRYDICYCLCIRRIDHTFCVRIYARPTEPNQTKPNQTELNYFILDIVWFLVFWSLFHQVTNQISKHTISNHHFSWKQQQQQQQHQKIVTIWSVSILSLIKLIQFFIRLVLSIYNYRN